MKIDSRAIYRYSANLNLDKTMAVKFGVRAPWISRNMVIDDVVRGFYRARTNVLPFLSGKKVRGVLTRRTLLKILLSTDALHGMKAGDFMTSPVLTVDITSSIAQTRALMHQSKVNRLAVIDGSKFVGIVTNHDIVSTFLKFKERRPGMKDVKYSPKNLGLVDVVNRDVFAINDSSTLSDSARKMVENNISSLLVLKNGSPAGVLTVRDLLESVIINKRVQPQKIFVSGLDNVDYDYGDEVRTELEGLLDKLERSKNFEVDYITLHVKKIKIKSYEINARLSLGGAGTINVTAENYIFEDTLRELMAKLNREVDRVRGKYLTTRKAERMEYR